MENKTIFLQQHLYPPLDQLEINIQFPYFFNKSIDIYNINLIIAQEYLNECARFEEIADSYGVIYYAKRALVRLKDIDTSNIIEETQISYYQLKAYLYIIEGYLEQNMYYKCIKAFRKTLISSTWIQNPQNQQYHYDRLQAFFLGIIYMRINDTIIEDLNMIYSLNDNEIIYYNQTETIEIERTIQGTNYSISYDIADKITIKGYKILKKRKTNKIWQKALQNVHNKRCIKCNYIQINKNKKCKKCQKVYYCSRKCQKEHWSKHKINCL